jgi:hypothetical protein
MRVESRDEKPIYDRRDGSAVSRCLYLHDGVDVSHPFRPRRKGLDRVNGRQVQWPEFEDGGTPCPMSRFGDKTDLHSSRGL